MKKAVVQIRLFQENRFFDIQPIFYIAGISKLIHKYNKQDLIIHLAQRLKSKGFLTEI